MNVPVAPRSEAGPANVPDETKPEPSSAQNNVEVRVRFVRLAAGAHNNSCGKELEDYCGTTLMVPLHCRYPHGFVASVQTIAGKCINRATLICGRQSSFCTRLVLSTDRR